MARGFLDRFMQRPPSARRARGRFGSARVAMNVATGAGNRCRKKGTLSQSGVTIIETMVAAVVLLIVVTGVLPVFIVGFQSTEQQGDIATRTTEYAQDKMELLMNLAFTDSTTNTTSATYPAPIIGGPGLGGVMGPSTTVGSIPPAAPVVGYVDYLDANGNPLGPTAAGAFYTRQWSILTDSAATPTLKTITVVVTYLQAGGIQGKAPSTTLVCVKSSGL
jgi:hypothetical protein